MNKRLEGKTAAVTGSARGIGRAIATRLAQEGAAVAVLDIGDIAETMENCRQAGVQVVGHKLDVSRKAEIHAVLNEVFGELGPVDILVNNAGVFDNTSAVELSEEKWDWVSDINYKAMFLLAQVVIPGMVKRGWGRIINMSSMSGKMAYPKEIAYCSTKAAVLGVTRALAIELAPQGITVNAICPGPVATTMLKNTHQGLANEFGVTLEEWERDVLKTIPVGRFGRPEEVASLAAFLASDEAAFINGQGINIDGGMVFY